MLRSGIEVDGAVTRSLGVAPLLAVPFVLALAFIAIVVAIHDERAYGTQRRGEAVVQARILAATLTAALSAGDREAADTYVDRLAIDPNVEMVAAFDRGGALISHYSRDATRPPPASTDALPTPQRWQVAAAEPVLQSGAALGSVYVLSSPESLVRLLLRHVGTALLMVLSAVMLIVLGHAQKALREANASLEQRARELAAANHDLQQQIRKRAEVEERLRQAQKMETIGQLTGGVAHDFNNILLIILGNLERLLRRLRDGSDPDLIRSAEQAMQGAARAAGLTRSLLAFARRQPLKPAVIDVNRRITDMSVLLRRTLGEKIGIETVLAAGLWRVAVDPNQFEHALLNLALNARDAMPDGGRLTIEAANAHIDGRYASEADISPGQYVVVAVSDTGVGMSEDILRRAFDPFFTTKEIGHGTGLGLSQVYGFIKQSGGHVKIYSEPGHGTTVKVYLPRATAEVEVPDAGPAAVLDARGASELVLLVEDDDGVRAHTVELVREIGYRVVAASNGAEALAILARTPDIALLFTDVGLPGGMNGKQLADDAKRLRADLPVLFTTGYARNAIVHEGRLDPGVHLVPKPFDREELAQALRIALATPADSTPVEAFLIVEDEPLILLNTVDDLKDLGCNPIEAATGDAAFAAAQVAGDHLTAAIIDLGLPDCRGDALAHKLRALRPELPILFVSGSIDADLRRSFAGDRRVAFLEKPYTPAALKSALTGIGVRVVEPRLAPRS